jgi:nucleotide-binding universal stress UspA family protein
VKTIFVSTDFSESSFNAVVYACHLAKAIDGKLILFHADFIPAPLMGTVPIEIILTPDELKSDSDSKLKKTKAALLESTGTDVDIELMGRFGNPQNEIISAAQFSKADLIVAGMRGAGVIKETIGSTATKLMHSSPIPVLIVPDKSTYSRPDNIVFATDGKDIKQESIELLRQMAFQFQSAIHIIHVYPKGLLIDKEAIIDTLDSHFIGLLHIYDFIESDFIDDAVENYAKQNEADMLVIMPRRHGLFEKLFTENHSKHLAFHSETPVLALSDKQ